MDIPNIFKNRTGAIQLSDLDDNFSIIKVSVNTHDQQIATLQQATSNLTTQIANFSAIPIGCIILWSGTIATIPSGWRLCDGTNNTPDLRDKFVIGAKQDAASRPQTTVTGANTYTGGQKDAGVVAHTHGATSTAVNTATSTAVNTVNVSNDTMSKTGRLSAQNGLLGGNGVFAQAAGYTDIYGTAFNYRAYNQNDVDMNISHTHNHIVSVASAITTNVSSAITTTVTSYGDSGTNANLPPYYALAYIMKV